MVFDDKSPTRDRHEGKIFCWNMEPKCRPFIYLLVAFRWNMRTCWYTTRNPESARKRQTLKLLSVYGAFNCEELTFNDLYIRKMKCSVMLCLWTRRKRETRAVAITINKITRSDRWALKRATGERKYSVHANERVPGSLEIEWQEY